MKMNSVGREINVFFWIERLFMFLLVIFPTSTYLLDLIVPVIIFTSIFTILFFLAYPNLTSVGPFGIGGIWLFLLDRSMFYLAFEYLKLLAGGFDLAFLWRLTVFLSILIHSIYIFEHLLRSHQTLPPSPPSPSPPQPQNDEGDVCKEVQNMKELVEDGKKMMMTCMDHMIISSLETQRKEWLAFLEELNKDGKKMMTKLDGMICSQLGTLRDNMRLNVDEIWQELRDELRSKVDEDIKASRQDFNKDVKSVADQLCETYLVIQETVKEANLIGQKKRQVIRGEDIEGFVELRKQVQRMAIEAEIAAEELSRATVELVEAGIQQWEEDNADYLASLPLLYR